MNTDTLSDVLSAVRLSGGMFFRVQVREPYAVGASGVAEVLEAHAPDATHVMPFHLVTRGRMWFDIEGADSVCLDEGDIVVLPHGAPHSVTDTPGRPAIPVGDLGHAIEGTPPTLRWGGNGAEAGAVCGFFRSEGRVFNPLIESLPEVLVIRRRADRAAWVAATLERTFNETLETRPGSSALVERLTELLFIEVVQRYVEEQDARGWLGALNDPVVGKSLALLHAEPARHWSLDDLASAVGASKSMLSQRFTDALARSPMRYLAAWRMEVASHLLLNSRDSIATIASAVGYESEAAFNRAFRRHVGEPPAAWRRRALALNAPLDPPGG